MPVFAYTALDRQGRGTSGTIPADSRAAALDQVMGRGLSPVSVVEQQSDTQRPAKPVGSVRVSNAAIEAFTRELANLLSAGLPLSLALHLLRREASHPGAKQVWANIDDDVVGGVALEDAMAK